MKKLIEKYIKRILIDYPEEDKLYIDLMQFAHEINSQATNESENGKAMMRFIAL